jgi:hypothetical protein
MPRTARLALGDMIFHVLNRGSAREEIFSNERTPIEANDHLYDDHLYTVLRLRGTQLRSSHTCRASGNMAMEQSVAVAASL